MINDYAVRVSTIAAIMLILFLFVQNERLGRTYNTNKQTVDFLIPRETSAILKEDIEYLVVFNSKEKFSVDLKNNVIEVLNYMSINNFIILDIYNEIPQYSSFGHIIFAMNDYFYLSDTLDDLILFVGNGGTVLIASSILPNGVYNGLYRYLGINESRDMIGTSINEVEITSSGFLAGISEGEIFHNDGLLSIQDFILNVRLEDTAEVFMRDANSKRPLAWKSQYKEGYFIVYAGFNNALKSNRGVLAALISQLKPVSIYPIANAFVMYIDGYPAPATNYTSESIRNQYGRNERDFITDIWWRDMRNISRRYSIPYTASIIATNNLQTSPPFNPVGGDELIIRSSSKILSLGGEVGLYGYNAVPLIKNSYNIYEEEYLTWESKSYMEESLAFLLEYTTYLLDTEFNVYVPPNNFLDEFGREAVINELDVKVISSTYIDVDDSRVYSQEFFESKDGIIELPRIGRGYIIKSSDEFVYTSLNTLHGIHTHYITPYEMFHDWSNQGYTWREMKKSFESFISVYLNRFKYIRPMPASQAALATQKYLQTNIIRKFENNILNVEIEEYFPGQFFYLRTDKKIKSYENVVINKVSHNYYIVEALGSDFNIVFY